MTHRYRYSLIFTFKVTPCGKLILPLPPLTTPGYTLMHEFSCSLNIHIFRFPLPLASTSGLAILVICPMTPCSALSISLAHFLSGNIRVGQGRKHTQGNILAADSGPCRISTWQGTRQCIPKSAQDKRLRGSHAVILTSQCATSITHPCSNCV